MAKLNRTPDQPEATRGLTFDITPGGRWFVDQTGALVQDPADVSPVPDVPFVPDVPEAPEAEE